MTRTIWLNGKLLPEERAVVSLYDSAMMYGDAVYTMLRTFNREPFQWEAHEQRLFRSVDTVGIHPAWLQQLRVSYDELTAANADAFAADDEIRTVITASRGPLPLYPHLEPGPWVMICQYPLRWVLRGKSHLYRDGVRAVCTEIEPIPERNIPFHVKHHNRLHFRLAELDIASRHGPEAWALVMLDGCILEATGANWFTVIDGVLHTPAVGCLPGISRAFVIRLALRLGIRVREDNWLDLPTEPGSEAFFTCTPFSIVPCTRINGAPIGDGTPGPITRRLTAAWQGEVDCLFVKQAERWDADGV